MFTMNNYKDNVVIKHFGNTPQLKDGIKYESTKYSYEENAEVKYFERSTRKEI